MKASALWFNNVIKKWEGGVGERPKEEDSGGLTNHGVTIGYWTSKAARIVNKPPTRSGLISLTWDEAQKISKVDFWDRLKIDTIRNPALRPFVADAYWLGGGLKSLGYDSIAALNRDFFATPKKLYNARMAHLQKLSNWGANSHGWTNRINDVLRTARIIDRKKWLIVGGSTILIGGTAYFTYRYFKK